MEPRPPGRRDGLPTLVLLVLLVAAVTALALTLLLGGREDPSLVVPPDAFGTQGP